MDFELSESERAFRDELRAWLKANAPRDGVGAGDQKSFVDSRRAWQQRLNNAGYLGLTWPEEYGGRGRGFMEQLIFNDEMILAHAPDPINVIGLGIGGPLVIAVGTQEQKKRYLAPLLSANEIFFHDVKVPKSQILGEPGQGWAVAMTTLLHERGTLGLALATRAQITADELAEHARNLGRGSDPLVRQRIAQHTIEARALQLNGYRALTAVKKNGIPGPEGSILKLMWSELNQRMPETAMDIAGPAAQVGDGDGSKYQILRSRAKPIE